MPDSALPTETSDDFLRKRLRDVGRYFGDYRLTTQKNFAELEAKLREQESKLHENDRYIHKLHVEIGELKKYIHERHEERNELKAAIATARSDVESFTHKLAHAEAELRRLEAARKSSIWWLVKPLFNLARKLGAQPESTAGDLPNGVFTYYLHTSPFRIYRPQPFTLRGWALAASYRPITALRVRVDETEFAARTGFEEPDVVKKYQLDPAIARPGFEVEIKVPVGKHRLRLEACLEGKEWVSVLNTWIWCQE